MTTNSKTGSTATSFPGPRRAYRCDCGRPVFFRNSECLACRRALGYEPYLGRIISLDPSGEAGIWFGNCGDESGPRSYRRCENLSTQAACNWLISVDHAHPADGLCAACCLNRTIPNLGNPSYAKKWRKIEDAKRRLVSSLLGLGLPVDSKLVDPERGLAFDLLSEDDRTVITGHDNGVITLNIAEADDATREGIRQELHEPYRTVLGHLRHEIGHYYWDRLIRGTQWLEPFRELFGDEQTDYSSALQVHYANGPPLAWRERFISSYASSHPWEDWAETWAHYLHIGDTLNTAHSFGLNINAADMLIDEFEVANSEEAEGEFGQLVNSWVRLSAVLNELSRSMGLRDFYPFVLSKTSIRKMHFIHRVIAKHTAGED